MQIKWIWSSPHSKRNQYVCVNEEVNEKFPTYLIFFQKLQTCSLFKETLEDKIWEYKLTFRSGLTDLTVVFPTPEKKTSWEAAIQEAKEKLGKNLQSCNIYK